MGYTAPLPLPSLPPSDALPLPLLLPSQLPKALLAIQRVIRERPYPGRGPRCPAEIVLQDLPIPYPSPFPHRPTSPTSPNTMDLCIDDKLAGAQEGHSDEHSVQTLALSQVALDTLDKR